MTWLNLPKSAIQIVEKMPFLQKNIGSWEVRMRGLWCREEYCLAV